MAIRGKPRRHATPRKVLPLLECAENPVGGGLVSHADWTGAPLATLLAKAQPDPQARLVRLSGADGFTRTIPIAKALHPDTLVAYRMNSEKLLAKHGFPLRALIPGWYGMDSVKWLDQVKVLSGEESPGAGTAAYVRHTRSMLAGIRPSGLVS
ncbi:MAG: molybdopterin-dependent oxidoreductase, partial [Bryobacteraceae bacterium]